DVREKYDGVVIEVKKKNQDTWTPFLMESKVATDTLVALSSLAYKETYMARGQYFLYEDGEKVYAPYSDTIEFKIPHPADTLECGNAVPELTDCTNAGERAELEIGDVFNANGTTVSIDTITNQSVNGSSVIISGEGHLPFPILSKFGLKVSFDNIEINCADELKKGQVISVYDEKTAAMIDLNNILGKGAAGNDLKQEDASLTEVGPDDDLSGFKSGDLIVEDGKVSLIVGNGNVVQVGTVIDLSNSDAYNDNGALNDEDIYVKFSNPDHENIAFDDDPTGMIRRAATLSGNYVSFGEEYIIPWVATNPGRIFQLTAMPSKDLSKSGFTDVKFVLPASGTHVVLDAVENGDGSYSVSIPGMKVDVQNHVYAIARKGEGSPYENVGKLNLCCYSYKSKKVVIVPLLEGLSVNTDEVKKDLDRVYAKLGYTFEVELDDDAAHREGLSTTIGLETDFLSDFSDEMKELIFNYEINIGDAYDKDAAYLFLLDKPTGKHKAAAGIMPQKQQYGFIFMREVTSVTPSITHTMAHELGHGIFGLDHIFSGAYGIEEGATYNLMDYTEKTPNDALSYHEWTQINRPLPNWSALSRAEEDMWLKSPILTRKLMRDICLSYKNKEIVNQSNKYIVPEKECRITKYKQNGYEFIYFYKSKEEAEKYLNDNNELNDKTYALNVIEDQKGTTQKIDAMLSSNLKTCPNVFDEDDDEDFILELLRKIKLSNKFGEDLTLPFGSAEKDASEITLPNGSIITDVEVVVNKNSVSLKAVKTEHEWEIGFSDSVFCFGVSDETEQYPLQISCNATDATALRKYLGLKVSAINSMPVQPIDHYIVSVDDATIRKSEDRTKFENKNIPMGTEVVIVSEETVKGKVVAYVKLVDTVPELFYYTTKSNLTRIYTENFTCYAVKTDVPVYEIPFANSSKSNKFVVGKEYKFNYYCADYALLEGTKSQEKFSGVWVKYDDENIKRVYDLSKNPKIKTIGNKALEKNDFVSTPYGTNKYSWGSSFKADKFGPNKEVKIIAQCGDYYLLEGMKNSNDYSGAWIKKDKFGCNIEDLKTTIHLAFEDATRVKTVADAACNLCTRTALYYLTGDLVLFPASGSQIFFSKTDRSDNYKGNVSGLGKAENIVSDLNKGLLSEFFDEITKKPGESLDDFWKRLQDMADEGSLIVGAYIPDHVFLIVPGGLMDVVDNSSHFDDPYTLKKEYEVNPDLAAGDKYGKSWYNKKHLKVNRILECGKNVKCDNAPVYANMGYGKFSGVGVADDKKTRFYLYKKKVNPIK
ncbi:MAG: hypothetical protein J6C20_02260, partial [Paludibacteraceae bacterium]|nr:hypothetical protein [Paludibacteraceae bacterium]